MPHASAEQRYAGAKRVELVRDRGADASAAAADHGVPIFKLPCFRGGCHYHLPGSTPRLVRQTLTSVVLNVNILDMK